MIGAFLAFCAMVLVIVPGPSLRFGLWLADSLGTSFLRGAGIAGVVFGVVWIYFSVVLL